MSPNTGGFVFGGYPQLSGQEARQMQGAASTATGEVDGAKHPASTKLRRTGHEMDETTN